MIDDLSQAERRALSKLLAGEPLESAVAWLREVHLEVEGRVGWPHETSHGLPSEWGGTIDALRAMNFAGVSFHEPIMARSLEWLLAQQHEDGGFGSREMGYSALEPTAWTIVLLQEIGWDLADTRAEAALDFIESCVRDDGSVGTSPTDSDDKRIYPAFLTCWGVATRRPHVAQRTALFLRDVVDPATRLWPTSPGAAGNVASTSQVLIALLHGRLASPGDDLVRRAVDSMLAQQREDGSWSNVSETWFSVHQPHIPLRCDEFTTAWAVKALLTVGLGVRSRPVASALACLIDSQGPDGAWIFDPLENREHVWCLSRAVDALAMGHRVLVADAVQELETAHAVAVPVSKPQRWKRTSNFVRDNILYFLVSLVLLLLLKGPIFDGLKALLDWIGLDRSSLANNLVAAAIWATVVVGVAWLLRKIREGREDNDDSPADPSP